MERTFFLAGDFSSRKNAVEALKPLKGHPFIPFSFSAELLLRKRRTGERVGQRISVGGKGVSFWVEPVNCTSSVLGGFLMDLTKDFIFKE